MIEINYDKNSIKINIKGGYPIHEWTHSFERSENNKYYNLLLGDNLKNELESELVHLKRYFYNKGWEDKTKKKTKRDYFFGNFKRE